MGLIIQYSTPTTVQTGVIRVPISFTDDQTNNNLYVPQNAAILDASNFKLVDINGNDLPSDSYSISMEYVKNASYRDLYIRLREGSGSFRITTQDDFQPTGYETNEYRTVSTSGGISMQDPQTSRPVDYDISRAKTTDEPPDTPEPIHEQEEDEPENPEEDDNTGPEQTQFIASVPGLTEILEEGSGSEEEPESLTLSVAISHVSLEDGPSDEIEDDQVFPSLLPVNPDEGERAIDPLSPQGTRLQRRRSGTKIIVWFTWSLEGGRLVPVAWGGPTIDIDVRHGQIPAHFTRNKGFQVSAVFSEILQVRPQSQGMIAFTVLPHTAVATFINDNDEEIFVTGPSSDTRYFIGYDTLVDDAVPPNVRIIRPNQLPVSEPSLDIRFRWSERMSEFKIAKVNVFTQNFSGQELYVDKKNLREISAQIWEMNIIFSKDTEDTNDLNSNDVGFATIVVKKDAGTDRQGLSGPKEPVELTFNYDFKLVPKGTEIQDGMGNELTPLCFKSFSFETNPFLDKIKDGLGKGEHVGGGFTGVSDLTVITQGGKDYLFGMAQIARKSDNPNAMDPLTGLAGGALFQLIPSESRERDCKIDVIKAYDRYPAAARSLVEYEKRLYFYEGSHYSQKFERHDNMRTFSARHLDWRPHAGRLRSFKPGASNIREKDPTRDHGNSWRLFGEFEITVPQNIRSDDARLYEEQIFPHHKGTSAPMLVVGNQGEDPGDLYLYSGLGNLDHVNYGPFPDYEQSIKLYPASTLDNWILLKYSEQLEYRVPVLNTNATKGYDILNELAKVTGSYVGASASTIFYMPKYPRRAVLNSSLAKDAEGQIEYKENTRKFPQDEGGLVLLETMKEGELAQEIIRYVSHDPVNSLFLTLERGVHETEAQLFCPSTNPTYIYYIDYVLDMNANYFVRPINEISYRTDFNQLYNQFTLRHSTQNPPPNEEAIEHYIENKESVLLNGGKELEIEVPSLDERYQPWIEWLGEFYTDFYSNLHYLTNLTVVSSFHFKLGDTVLLRESELSQMTKYRKLQVINISQNKEDNTTRLQLRTL